MPLLSMSQDGEIFEIDRDFNESVYGRGASEETEGGVMVDDPSLLMERMLASDRRDADLERQKQLAMSGERKRLQSEAKAFQKRRNAIALENRDMAREQLMGDDPLLTEAVLSSFGSPADFSVTNFDRNGLSPIGEPDYTMQLGFEPPQGSMGDLFSDFRDQAYQAVAPVVTGAAAAQVQRVLMPAPQLPQAAPQTTAMVPMPSSAGGSIQAGGVPFLSRKVAGVPMPLVLGGVGILVLGGIYATRKR